MHTCYAALKRIASGGRHVRGDNFSSFPAGEGELDTLPLVGDGMGLSGQDDDFRV
jgi:hypothetical protein